MRRHKTFTKHTKDRGHLCIKRGLSKSNREGKGGRKIRADGHNGRYENHLTEDLTKTLSMNMIIYRFDEMMDEKEDLPEGAMSRNRSNTRHLGEGKERIHKQPFVQRHS